LYASTNDDDDDEEEDDDEPPEVDIRDFKYPSGIGDSSNNNRKNGSNSTVTSFGLGRGRSSPSQRKAMGTSSKTSTTVFVCSNCGSESVQWRGRCPTCKEWNSFQEVEVKRSNAPSAPVGGLAHNLLEGRNDRSLEAGRRQTNPSNSNHHKLDGQSWLDGISAESSRIRNPYDGPGNRPVSISDIDLEASESRRLKIPDDDEMNQVLGGGLMKGSLILLGGDPGVGKSTLALQMAAQVASLSVAPAGVGMGASFAAGEAAVGPVWYVSGEETMEQIATRALRLVPNSSNDEIDSTFSTTAARNRLDALPKQLFLLSETNLNVLADDVIQTWIDEKNYNEMQALDASSLQTMPPPNLSPSLIVIDSIQTMVCEGGGSSSAGGISQVRESMALLLRLAKTTQIPILAIGHVTKTGDVAGPRMVEHMVDAVLYLEHSQSSASSTQNNGNFRWLRAQKNRFGSCQVAGLYDFREGILVPLPEGTESALAPPPDDLEGCAMGVCVEGPHRAMTVEVQALVTQASGSFGKKTVEGGLSSARLNLLLGILQKHCQLPIAGGGRIGRDVYVNVVGCDGTVSKSQLSLATMSLDLAVTVALTSSYLGIPARGDTACLAQVGLLGELRPLSSLESRLLQAQRMGFSSVIVASTHKQPSGRGSKKRSKSQKRTPGSNDSGSDGEFRARSMRKYGLDVYECSTLKEALNLALTSPLPIRSKTPGRRQPKSSGPTTEKSNWAGHRTSPPGSLRDLNLDDEVILDDEDDEFNDF
jgi:DNA repair protein RadA/Sms